MIGAYLNKGFWVVLFLSFTFLWTVLFNHGIEDYVENCKKDAIVLKDMVMGDPKAKKPK